MFSLNKCSMIFLAISCYNFNIYTSKPTTTSHEQSKKTIYNGRFEQLLEKQLEAMQSVEVKNTACNNRIEQLLEKQLEATQKNNELVQKMAEMQHKMALMQQTSLQILLQHELHKEQLLEERQAVNEELQNRPWYIHAKNISTMLAKVYLTKYLIPLIINKLMERGTENLFNAADHMTGTYMPQGYQFRPFEALFNTPQERDAAELLRNNPEIVSLTKKIKALQKEVAPFVTKAQLEKLEKELNILKTEKEQQEAEEFRKFYEEHQAQQKRQYNVLQITDKATAQQQRLNHIRASMFNTNTNTDSK